MQSGGKPAETREQGGLQGKEGQVQYLGRKVALLWGTRLPPRAGKGMTESPESAETVSKQGIDATDRDHSGARG